jgi:hypothetical protein
MTFPYPDPGGSEWDQFTCKCGAVMRPHTARARRHFVYAGPLSPDGTARDFYCPVVEGLSLSEVVEKLALAGVTPIYWKPRARLFRHDDGEWVGLDRSTTAYDDEAADYGHDDDETTYVYRLYGRSGNLLYVGITDNLDRRWREHAASKHWWGQVAQKESEPYPSRLEAKRAEAMQIRNLKPVHNRDMNGW